jgi:hypothetical protein
MSELDQGGGVEKSGWAGRIINNFYCINYDGIFLDFCFK